MARIELRNCTVKIKDGLAGTASINEMSPMAGDGDLTINDVSLNTAVTTKVPIGARFKVAGETNPDTVHVVTGRTPSDSGPTTNITFSPVLGAGSYANDGVLTFQPQELIIKIGDGDLNYTENDEFIYDLDRGELDGVRQGEDQPMEVALNFVYEHITTGTNEQIAPMDAIKRRNGASEWVSASEDKCEPYCVDIEVTHTPPCGTSQVETTTFPDFRSEQREVNFRDANVSINGRCNATEPIVARS